MSLSNSFAPLRPSLLLDFAGSETIDPRITFARASTARFYDQNTVAKAEENLFLYSQVFTNAWWQKPVTVSVTDNAAVAPDGTTTAARLVYSVQFGCVMASVSLVSGLQYTVSFWALNEAGSNTYSVYNNTALTSIGTYTPTGSWVRYSFTFTATATGTTLITIAQDRNASGFGSQWIWGAQLEQRSAVTAYTATTTAPITRYQPQLMTAAANIARLDHDPITREARGLLIEESRSNLLTFSEDLQNGAWQKVNATVVANAAVAPDGTLTADLLVPNATNSADHSVFQLTGSGVTNTYTASVYVKSAGYNFAELFDGIATNKLRVNLTDGSFTTVGSPASVSVTAVGNGWYRCTFTRAVAAASLYIQIGVQQNASGTAFSGDGYSGVFVWAGQQEVGAFATSYIPRLDATAASRAADAASMTGTNFTSWFSAGEGVLYAEYNTGVTSATVDTPGTARGVAAITDNTPNNRLRFAISTFLVRAGGATVAEIYGPVMAAGTTYKTAAVYALNDYAWSVDGVLSGTDTSGVLPTGLSRLDIGASTEAGGILNGYVRKLAFYPRRLTNAQLQALTR